MPIQPWQCLLPLIGNMMISLELFAGCETVRPEKCLKSGVVSDGLQVDRFIPARNAFDVDLASFKMSKENDGVASPTASTPSKVRCLL